MLKQSIFSAAGILAVSVPAAFGHGPVIPLTQSGGTVQTNQLDLDGNDAGDYTPAGLARTFPVIPMAQRSEAATATADNGWYGQIETAQPSNGEDTTYLGPGLAYGHGGFSSTTAFKVTFAGAASVWQPDATPAGGSFVATGGETIQGVRGNFGLFANTAASNGASTGTGLSTGQVGTAANAHSQIRWRLLGADGTSVPNGTTNVIDDGLYLAALQVTAYSTHLDSGNAVVFDSPIGTPSQTFYLLFEKNQAGNITSTDLANAQAAVAALVPEPTSAVAMIGLSGALLRRRRR